MSIRKYGLLTIVLWLIAYFSSLILGALGLVQTQTQLITAVTFAYLGMTVVLTILYVRQHKSGQQMSFEKTPRHWLIIIGLGFLSVYAALILQYILIILETAITGETIASQNTQDIVGYIREAPLFLLSTSIAAPIMEEFVFRRAIPGLIGGGNHYWLGAVISSIIFAFAHGDGHLQVYFTLGLFFCLLYKKTGSIWTSIVAHAGMNSLVLFAQLFFVNNS